MVGLSSELQRQISHVCTLSKKKTKKILPEEQNVSFDKVFTSPHHVQVFSESLFCFVTRAL
jgi:hypothetical protein